MKKENELTNLAVIDTVTGELDRYLTIGETKRLDKYNSASSCLNDNVDIRRNGGQFEIFIYENCGGFNHSYYGKLLDHKYIFRFVYLCTFVNYKGYITYGKAKGEGKLITKKDLQEILKLKNQQFYDTINYYIDNELIYITDEGHVKINNSYCNRGKLIKNNMKNGAVRMFDEAIREIYENSNPKEHEKLGLLIKLIPYMHFSTNALVENPHEEDLKLIKPLKQKQILEILSITKPTALQLLKIKMMSGTEFAFIKVSNGELKNVYVFNPRFAFKGNESTYESIKGTLKLFQMGL